MLACDATNWHAFEHRAMQYACDLDSRCAVACKASARGAKSLAMWVERCEPQRWVHANGTVCPLAFYFALFNSHFVQFKANPWYEASFGLVALIPCLVGISVWGLGTPNSPFSLFNPLDTPKTRHFTGKMSMFDYRKCQKDKWFQFHAGTGGFI